MSDLIKLVAAFAAALGSVTLPNCDGVQVVTVGTIEAQSGAVVDVSSFYYE